jgi:hypothetical protein
MGELFLAQVPVHLHDIDSQRIPRILAFLAFLPRKIFEDCQQTCRCDENCVTKVKQTCILPKQLSVQPLLFMRYMLVPAIIDGHWKKNNERSPSREKSGQLTLFSERLPCGPLSDRSVLRWMMEWDATIILVEVFLDCCTRRTKYHVLQAFDLQRLESRFGLHAASETLHSLQYRIQIQTHIQIQLTT